jgi:acetylserotonin O-methyltransferase
MSMTEPNALPDPSPVVELLMAFRRSQTMFTAVSLGVFDKLSQGSKDSAELASGLGTDPEALARLLDACVGLGLLQKRGGRYANTPAAVAYLTTTGTHRLTGYILYSKDVLWKLWGHLDDAVREGTHRWNQAFGWDGPIFSSFFRTDDALREFLMGMHGLGRISSPHVIAAFDLGRFRRLVDLGGATGHLAIAACERYPDLKAKVFDLPAAQPLAREIIASSTVADRITLEPGDFFTDPLPAGDLFALGRIVHDWSEEKIKLLLRRVHDALPGGGAVLIAEKLVHDDRTGPVGALMQDLNMLTCTEGKERTLGDYASLLQEAGFVEVQGVQTPSPLDAVMAVKP